jgi:hypothetical protein
MKRLEDVLNRPLGIMGGRKKLLNRRSVAGVLREIHRLNPARITVCYPTGSVDVPLDILFRLWSDGHLKRVCSHEVTMPRRGWVVLVPRELQARDSTFDPEFEEVKSVRKEL